MFLVQNLPWDEAREICKTQEATGDLVSITSEPIQKFLESLATNTLAFWIGSSMNSGSFEWSDGSQWSYVPAGTELGSAYAQDGDGGVLALTVGYPGLWFFEMPDNNRAMVHGCICQY